MDKRLTLLLGCMAAGACLPAHAADSGAGLKLGTLGLGLEYEHRLTESLSGRLGFNALNFSHTVTSDDNDYDGDVQLRSFSALLDWYPSSGSGFRVTAGALYNGNEVDLTATDTGQMTLGDTTYDITGTLHGNADFNKLAPYLGIGWNHVFGAHDRWSVGFDLGVMYQGSPDISLSAEGTYSEVGNPGNSGTVDSATFQDDLRREEANLEKELEDYKYYPVLAVTLVYRF